MVYPRRVPVGCSAFCIRVRRPVRDSSVRFGEYASGGCRNQIAYLAIDAGRSAIDSPNDGLDFTKAGPFQLGDVYASQHPFGILGLGCYCVITTGYCSCVSAFQTGDDLEMDGRETDKCLVWVVCRRNGSGG